MTLIAGPTDMVGGCEDRKLVNSLPLLALLFGKFFWKLLHLPLHLLLEFFQLGFLFPDLFKIPFQLQAIIVDQGLRLRPQGRSRRSTRAEIAATRRGSRHESVKRSAYFGAVSRCQIQINSAIVPRIRRGSVKARPFWSQ